MIGYNVFMMQTYFNILYATQGHCYIDFGYDRCDDITCSYGKCTCHKYIQPNFVHYMRTFAIHHICNNAYFWGIVKAEILYITLGNHKSCTLTKSITVKALKILDHGSMFTFQKPCPAAWIALSVPFTHHLQNSKSKPTPIKKNHQNQFGTRFEQTQ